MAALATLPVFLGLAGKRAVVAGGTAPAAWKAELLAAAGADVEVYAKDVSPEMTALIARGAAAGSIALIEREWTPESLAGAAIAIADAENDAEAAAFFRSAHAAGVPVNVIDKPAYCQFQFGAIVNRSPVVVAISTEGAAPILGQAIRRRIETLLPPALAAWGHLARTLRERVGERLAAGPQRRAFWERFVDRAFGAAPKASDQAALDVLIDTIATTPATARGRVTLVGAGPGDAELLTLKAVRTLQAADVILYDDLVSDAVLELARREAKRMLVGKRGGRASCAQADINALMIKLAHQGRHVVRLKSGDPMIFGRAGEEIEVLEQAGIPFEIVPGITSASAMAATLGLSLTHRDFARSIRFITGHAHSGALPESFDWHSLAAPDTTLIVYMGGGTVSAMVERLIAAGLPRSTPAVAASDVSRDGERRWQGTLAALPLSPVLQQRVGPVLIGIGAALGARPVATEARPAEAFEAPLLAMRPNAT